MIIVVYSSLFLLLQADPDRIQIESSDFYIRSYNV